MLLLLQLFKCFNQLGICQSVTATRRNIDLLVDESDKTLQVWRHQLEQQILQVDCCLMSFYEQINGDGDITG